MKRTCLHLSFAFAAFSIAAMMLSSCSRSADDPLKGGEGHLSAHFVEVYVCPDQIKATALKDEDGKTSILMLLFRGESITSTAYATRDRFLEIAESYGDTSYKGLVADFMNEALACGLDFIRMTSDMDYDAAHPAGSDLSDIVMLQSVTPRHFILNGYSMAGLPECPESWRDRHTGVPERAFGYSPIECRADEVNQEVTAMMYPNCYLILTRKPEHAGVHTFHLSAGIGGQTFSTAVRVEF